MQGKTINGYTLKHQLGIGGMAEVWLAENAIGKQAAVKLLLPKFCNDEAIIARFQNEAKVMVKLDHPNIRQVYDFGSIDGRPCIVMEYLEGDDLKALMKQGRCFTNDELVKWWNQIADALNYTHAKGIVHRDIKPSNLFLDAKGNIKLLDFGIAKIKESISMTQTGSMMGTLMYMSPEQVRDSKHIGPESDAYSLAVSFVHLLSGKKPYDSDTSSDYDIRKGIVEIPLDLTGVPADWQGFLAPYLEKRPEDRPALRPFEAVPLPKKAETPPPIDDDESTIVAGSTPKTPSPNNPKPKPQKPHSGLDTLSHEPKDKPKGKKGLWIGLGVALVLVAAILLFVLPKRGDDSPYPGYKKNQNGLYYQFFTQNEGQRPQVGELIDLAISCCVNDTNFISPVTENTMQVIEPLFAGDIFEGLAMMHKGDSASFIVNIDSTFAKFFNQPTLPAEFKSTDVLRFEVRLDDFYPESEYATRYHAKIMEGSDARIAKMKADYPDETATAARQLREYMAKNNIEAQPTASGLYYVMTRRGNGEKPNYGQNVQVHYTGRLLNGTVFDSSYDRGEPLSVTIGVGQVIPGWDEGVMLMSKGERGVLYIPYYLAYGDKAAGDKIVPFSNLIFEVELVDFQ